MTDFESKTIEIPEICRVEGHAAVVVDISDNRVLNVHLEVFEGTRFFERIVLGHKFDEMPHITSRICAICSTGHVLSAVRAIERISDHHVNEQINLYRELMHLGMIIESHATHICALALPDFLGTPDLVDFACAHQFEFEIWIRLRKLGANIQTVVGGRPFHPVNLHVGGLSRYPTKDELRLLLRTLGGSQESALHLCQLLASFNLPLDKTIESAYLALIPQESHYGYFGDRVQSSEGWQASIDEYQSYLSETVVPYSHAKQVKAGGKIFMVGAMARLSMFGERLGQTAASVYEKSALASGSKNTILNNLAQAIEIVEAIDRAHDCIMRLLEFSPEGASLELTKVKLKPGTGVGAVECPRGTLYHLYQLDESGIITGADMVTPSTQNSARIESDIRAVVEQQLAIGAGQDLQANLETLVRAYDPCNTCATHMVQVKYGNSS